MWDSGCGLPTQEPSGRSHCFCGVEIDIAGTHRHVYATHLAKHEIRPPNAFADPEIAARKIIELANAVEALQDGRIYIEKINGPTLFQLRATPAEYKAGLDRAIANGWLVLHESRYFGTLHPSRRGSIRLGARPDRGCDEHLLQVSRLRLPFLRR